MKNFGSDIKFRLPWHGLFLLGLVLPSVLFGDAWAQMSVVSKTASAPPSQSGFGLSIANPWKSAIMICDFRRKSEPCRSAAKLDGTGERASQPLPSEQSGAAQLFENQTGASETENAVSVAVSALFEVQKLPKEAAPEGDAPEASSTAPAVNPFQLSETLEWRVEAADADANGQPGAFGWRAQPNNPVGVFASQTLLQAGENASVRFDAGVNVEGKNDGNRTGSTAAAGKAGFVMAW